MQKPNLQAEVYKNNKNYDRKKEKIFKSLIRFHSVNKIDNYNGGGREEKKKKIQRKLQNKSDKHKNNKFFA